MQLRDSVDPVSPWRSVCRHVSVASRVVAAQTLPYALSISASDVRTVYSHRAPEGAVCDHSPLTPFHLPMASTLSRSLPVPSGPVKPLATDGPYHNDIYSPANPYHTPLPRPPYTALPVDGQPPAATLRGGTLLHRGFLRSTGADPDAITLSISLRCKCRSYFRCGNRTKIRGFS